MYAIASFLIVASISMATTQLVTGALVATGLPLDIAKFQARSAFSGAGYTTTESENIVNHPQRRKIISLAMFVGNLGTPTLIVAVVVGFLEPGPGSPEERLFVGAAGRLFLLMVLTNRPVRRLLRRLGGRYGRSHLEPAMQEGFTELLAVGPEHVIGEVRLELEPSTTFRSLRGLDEALSNVHVLGVRQGDGYVGDSPADINLARGDAIVLYGTRERVERHAVDVRRGHHHHFRRHAHEPS